MSRHPTKIVDRLAAAVRAHDARAVARCFTPAGVLEVPAHGLQWAGQDQVERAALALFVAFGDLTWRPRARWVDNAATVEEGVWSGTHDGPLGERPATGRQVEIRARVWIDHDEAAVHRMRVYSDPTALKLGLGLAVSAFEEASDTSRLAAATGSAGRARVFVRPEPVVATTGTDRTRPRRRRAGRVLAVLVMTLGVIAAGVVTADVLRESSTTAPNAEPRPAPSATRSSAPSRSQRSATPRPSSGVTRRGRNLDLSTDVLFAPNSATLTSRARAAIEEVAGVLRRLEADGTVQVNGHTDDEGSAGYNLRLSRERAEAVAAALGARYDGDLELRATGFGEARPVAGNDTEAGRARNRRVTIVLPRGEPAWSGGRRPATMSAGPTGRRP